MIEYKLVSRHDFYETSPNKPEKRYPYLLIKHIHYELKRKTAVVASYFYLISYSPRFLFSTFEITIRIHPPR